MIRRATLDDMDTIVALAEEFVSVSPYAWAGFSAEGFAGFAAKMLEHGAIFLSDDGMIGGILNPLFFNPEVVTAGELFWFARSEGQELRRTFEEWAASHGAVAITCSALANQREETMRKVYARAGYIANEIAFVKRFTP